MPIEIRRIEPTVANLTRFAQFPIDYIYKDNPYYVPALVTDERDTLDLTKNPAADHCESIYFMAFDGDKPVGRIAGIINHQVNEREGVKTLRFGFVDFIDHVGVVDGLFDAIFSWGRGKGMTQCTGPLGFTDMDQEGCLIEGFDQLGTQASIYNHDYYPKHFERLGFTKAADWVEMKIMIPKEIPEKMARVSKMVQEHFKLHNVHCRSRKELKERWGDAIFHLINEAYDSLFGYSPLTQAQVDHYIKLYLPYLPLDHISIIADEHDQLIGVGITLPSLSRALIKSRGRLLPFGWYHLLHDMRYGREIVDLMLVAVKPQYQNKGVNSLLFTDLIPVYNRRGYKWAESNPELETNRKVLMQWQYFDLIRHKRRRAFTMPIPQIK